MTTSEFDSFRPPERRRRRGGAHAGRRKGGGRRGADGSREMAMVPEAEFSSYYGRPIVKPAPWEDEVAAYLFLGGLGAGSALLAAGAQLTGNVTLRRNTRFAALASAGLGTVALIRDLGRPERFLHMLRTVKLTSPMSVGSWILVTFSTGAGVAAAGEVDRLTGHRVPLGSLRGAVEFAERAGGMLAGFLAPGLAAYTAVLLTNTATPTWSGAREHLPFVFAGSASLAAGGLAMITTGVDAAGPARRLALAGTGVELLAAEVMLRSMDETEAEPLREGEAGRMLAVSKGLAVAGGAGTLLAGWAASGGRRRRWSRAIAVASGAALVASSALNRLGVFRAGMVSANDPRYTVAPQKRRLARRRRRGETGDSITTSE